ncbi:MAG: ABC transporter substrate-binding protein [Oscillospiraceae bacterium]|nr:ABC transporter substrate-binding protein [Oscillospiraceae bacterium]
MKKTAKIGAVAAAAAMAISLGACQSTPTETTVPSGEPAVENTASTQVYHIGIVQQEEHAALDAATLGFQEKLTELLGAENVVFDPQIAQGDMSFCTTIVSKFVADDVDLIMANATTALQAASSGTTTIPVVGTSVTDYVTAGVVESNDHPGSNVTGTSDLAPIGEQIDLLTELLPDAAHVGLLYCSAEPNSLFQIEKAEEALDAKGVTYTRYTIADSNDLQAVMTKAASEVDAIYIPTDNTIAKTMDLVKNISLEAGTPVITGEENMCKGGGLATLSISYYDLGTVTAQMAYEILVNGQNPADMPIEFASAPTKMYNPEIAEALGITIPADYVALDLT